MKITDDEIQKSLENFYGDESGSHYPQEDHKRMRSALEAAIACQGLVMKDAERYLKLRNAPLGVDGVPCVALPKGERSGDYINADYLDAAVDGMPMGESIEEKIQGVIESHEIAKGVKTDNGEDWENGYAFAVESMLGDLNALIAKANGHDKQDP